MFYIHLNHLTNILTLTVSPTLKPLTSTLSLTLAVTLTPPNPRGCFADVAFTKYRIQVSKNAGANYWCILELSFYDKSGKIIPTQPSGGSAQSFFAGKLYVAGKAYFRAIMTTLHLYPNPDLKLHTHTSHSHSHTLHSHTLHSCTHSHTHKHAHTLSRRHTLVH